MVDHPAGLLAIAHRVDCSMLAAEDATRGADADPTRERGLRFTRPATQTERELLAALGHGDALVLEELETHVDATTRALVVRTWPDLPPLTTT